MGTPASIIVRMPNWLGDMVMAIPVLEDLRKQFPNASITAMCLSPNAPLLIGNPHINEIFPFHRPSGYYRRSLQERIIDELRKGKYDLGLLLTNSLASAWWFWRGKVRRRIGFSTGFRSIFLTDALPVPKDKERRHLVTTYKELLQPLGISLSNTPPKLYLDPKEIVEAKELLSRFGITETAIVIGFNPGAAYGSAKCWPPEHFRKLTEKLLAYKNVFCLYFGNASSESLVHQICHDLPDRVINLANKTSLRQLMALIQCCHLFLTNDSGPMHIASALNVPLIALFGSTNALATGPYSGGTVLQKQVACSPCYRRKCPIDLRCMNGIEVDDVLQAIEEKLPINHG